jgi:hypothetical protein
MSVVKAYYNVSASAYYCFSHHNSCVNFVYYFTSVSTLYGNHQVKYLQSLSTLPCSPTLANVYNWRKPYVLFISVNTNA